MKFLKLPKVGASHDIMSGWRGRRVNNLAVSFLKYPKNYNSFVNRISPSFCCFLLVLLSQNVAA